MIGCAAVADWLISLSSPSNRPGPIKTNHVVIVKQPRPTTGVSGRPARESSLHDAHRPPDGAGDAGAPELRRRLRLLPRERLPVSRQARRARAPAAGDRAHLAAAARRRSAPVPLRRPAGRGRGAAPRDLRLPVRAGHLAGAASGQPAAPSAGGHAARPVGARPLAARQRGGARPAVLPAPQPPDEPALRRAPPPPPRRRPPLPGP